MSSIPKHIRVFSLFTAAYFLSYFYRSANAVIAPDLSRDLLLGAAELGLMTSLFFGTFALVQIPLGVGLDRLGARWVTPALMLAGAVGSLFFAVASSFTVLAVGRALIGVGMAGILMGALKMFSQWYPARRFATVSGLLVGLGSTGALIAATPLAWLNQLIGWRAVFGLGTLIICLVAVSIVLWTRNAPPGVAWQTDPQAAGQLRAIFRDLRFWRIAPLTFFMTGSLLAFQGLWAGPYLFDVMQLTEIQAGNILLLMGLGVTGGFAASGWLSDRLGLARVVIATSILFVLCQFVLIGGPPLVVVGLFYALFGFFGGFNIMLLAHARQLFPTRMTGQAVTAVNLFGIGGTFFVQWWMGLIVAAFSANAAGHYPPQAHRAALLFTAVGSLLSLIWYLPLARQK